MPIDHVTVKVKDLSRAKAFYVQALAPLGYAITMEWQNFIGFGVGGKADFWVAQYAETAPPAHVAFVAGGVKMVDAFHRAGVAAGGTDNGPPGKREHYHPGFYGAFVHDPEGNNIEAVIHNFK